MPGRHSGVPRQNGLPPPPKSDQSPAVKPLNGEIDETQTQIEAAKEKRTEEHNNYVLKRSYSANPSELLVIRSRVHGSFVFVHSRDLVKSFLTSI